MFHPNIAIGILYSPAPSVIRLKIGKKTRIQSLQKRDVTLLLLQIELGVDFWIELGGS